MGWACHHIVLPKAESVVKASGNRREFLGMRITRVLIHMTDDVKEQTEQSQ